MSINLSGAAGLLVGFLLLAVSPGYAQDTGLCQSVELNDPPRTVFDCGNGLVIEADASSAFEFNLSPDRTSVRSIGLRDSALLIDLQPGSGPFQILTPQAIASVRGTIYVVDVHETETAVFVVRGVVSVSRADGSAAVDLAAGDGVTVADRAPLAVRQWPQEKVSDLLSRFDR